MSNRGQYGPRVGAELHERKHSYVIPIIAGGIAGVVLAAPILRKLHEFSTKHHYKKVNTWAKNALDDLRAAKK